jgi:DNA-binding NarL/FixJ family response regulator
MQAPAPGGRGLASVRRPPRAKATGAAELTFRERQVLIGVAQGYSSKEIAATLNRSVRTIVKHRSNMMRKLSLQDVSAVTRYAIARGFLCVAGG